MNLLDVVINTERLNLMAIDENFINDIFDTFTEDIAVFMYPQPSGNILNIEKFVKDSMIGLSDGTNLQLVIVDNKTDEFIGCCGLHNLNESEPELGIWLKKGAHKNGYGLEAIAGIIEWARSHINFDYLKYPVDRLNYPSRRIPEYFNGKIVKEYVHKNMIGKELDIIEYWIS